VCTDELKIIDKSSPLLTAEWMITGQARFDEDVAKRRTLFGVRHSDSEKHHSRPEQRSLALIRARPRRLPKFGRCRRLRSPNPLAACPPALGRASMEHANGWVPWQTGLLHSGPGHQRSRITPMSRSATIVLLAVIAQLLLTAAALAVECDTADAEIAARLDTRVEHSGKGATFVMRPPDTGLISIKCGYRKTGFLSVFKGAYPPAIFYDITAEVGSFFTGLPVPTFRERVILCAAGAMKSGGEHDYDSSFHGFRLNCASSTTDIGGSMVISFYRFRDADD
jgi:hypothetical protein